jgi:hypothetical protein
MSKTITENLIPFFIYHFIDQHNLKWYTAYKPGANPTAFEFTTTTLAL